MAARLNGGDYFKGFDPLITQLTNAGVRRIEGDLVADESYFTGPPFGSGWQWDDLQAYYGAEVSSLTVDDNALDLFVKPAERVGMPCRITTGPPTTFVTFINRTQTATKGSETHIVVYRPVAENIIYVSGTLAIDSSGYYAAVAVHNPAGLFVTLFKDALAARGIAVSGRTRVIDWKYREVTPVDFTRFIELGSVESMPLGDIVRETLKPSQNLYAQLLLLQVGAQVRTSGKKDSIRESEASGSLSTTEALGINSMNDFLARIGVKQGDVLLEEGSGLSRLDVITPQATVALLSYASRSSWAEIYRNALPIAGVDGTLQNRMKGTAAAGNVRAKTGTLRYVHALSGFVTTAVGEHLVFSIMLNNYNNLEPAALTGPAGTRAKHAPPAAPRDELDAIAIMLAGFTGHSQ
jgi:D-alanyl-D-alanine carboxypeptidase/D-alanyl-D-alanine-endopeptidase (penicillin-binding protein 4)